MARSRITGTVEEALAIEESLLGRKLPRSFSDWLLDNNGLDIEEVHIYPVRDERDTRKTWESLSYLLINDWAEGLLKFNQAIYSHLLPFADSGTSDYFCFDYSVPGENGERPIVLWSHKTGKTEFFAVDFREFEMKILAGASGSY
jgi:hypothetical protein